MYIQTEHLLLGVIHVADDITGNVFRGAGLSVETVKSEMPEPKPSIPLSVEIPLHSATKRALQYAAAESERSQGALLADYVLADDHIGPEHLLLGLLRVDDATAASILMQRGLTLDIVRRETTEHARKRIQGNA